MEIRIESVNKDNSHTWVRIFHGLNKLVTDLIDKEYDDNEQETSTTKTEVFAFASRSKGKSKPRRHSTTIFAKFSLQTSSGLYGAVAEMCEEYETLPDRTAQPVVGGESSSSLVLSVIKTETPLDCDDLANKDLLLQQYGERIEKPSQQDKLSKFCMDAGFLNVVEIGQYFMTKDTEEFSQFKESVACREYTLPRNE